MTPTRRLFFALSLPDPIGQQIVHWRAAQFAPRPGARWRRPICT
ncbi:2'-5'-RNA ligase [Dickeya solani]|nr:2'-5'-RNA ligase [Dickeya solani]